MFWRWGSGIWESVSALMAPLYSSRWSTLGSMPSLPRAVRRKGLSNTKPVMSRSPEGCSQTSWKALAK
jgi:hypothetical protein